VIASVGHHTDRTLIDEVAAISCSTPTHAAEAAVRVDVAKARALTTTHAHRLHTHARRAILHRARELAQLSRAPSEHVARHRRHLHQMLREIRASARRATDRGRALSDRNVRTLSRTATRATTSDATRRRADLDRLAFALAAHDPERTLARGYALVESRDGGEPLTSAAAATDAGEIAIRFHDGRVDAHTE
jgi:exodeoxyribonuclease VII large subunit